MAKIERNLVANFLGIGISAGAPLLFNIIYYRMLGSEAYGLIGLYLTAQMIAVSLDLGLTRATTREVAKAMSQAEKRFTIRSSVFTLLVLNILVFFALGLSVLAASSWISSNWIKQTVVDEFNVSTAIGLIGMAVAIHQPRSIFIGALNGLQGQVLTNILTVGSALSRGIITLIMLSRSPDLATFFWTQVVLTTFETIIIAIVVWIKLPVSGKKPRFERSIVRDVSGFAMGDGLNVIIGSMMIHGDKLLLSGLVPLQAFGTYSLLSLIAQSLSRLGSPFTMAYFPPLVTFWQQGDTAGLLKCFRQACLRLSTLLIPATFLAVILADPITRIVLDSSSSIPDSALVLVLLSLAFACNAMMHLPYTLQLASGWTRPGLVINTAAICFYIPLLLILVPEHGVIAAAWCLMVVMGISFPLFVEVTRRCLLGGQAWWLGSFLTPTLISAGCFIPAYFTNFYLSPWFQIAVGTVAGFLAFGLIRIVAYRRENYIQDGSINERSR